MTEPDDDLIRERAYAIWQSEGCPHDRGEQHWRQAAAELRDAQNEAREEAAADDQPLLATLDLDTAGANAAVPATADAAVAPMAGSDTKTPDPTSAESVQPSAARKPRKVAGSGAPAPRARRKKVD